MTIEEERQRIMDLWYSIKPKSRGDLANLWEDRRELGELEAIVEDLEPKVIKLLEVIPTLKRHSHEYHARTVDLIKLLHHFNKYKSSEEWIQKVTSDLNYISAEITQARNEAERFLQGRGFESIEKIMSKVYEDVRSNRFDLAKNSISLGYLAHTINDNQRDFLTDLVTKTESGDLAEAIKRLGSDKDGAAHYFEDLVHLNTVASAFLSMLFEKHPPNHQVKSYIQNLKSKLAEIYKEIDNICNLSGKQVGGLLFTLDKAKYFIGDLEAYESFYQGRPFKLYSLITPITQLPQYKRPFSTSREPSEYNNWCIREETRKILNPMDCFANIFDRFVTEDIVTAVDISDGLRLDKVKESTQQLINKSGLKDISPKVGDRFHAHLQTLIGHKDNYSRDMIGEISLRGFEYKGKLLRKANVVTGR